MITSCLYLCTVLAEGSCEINFSALRVYTRCHSTSKKMLKKKKKTSIPVVVGFRGKFPALAGNTYCDQPVIAASRTENPVNSGGGWLLRKKNAVFRADKLCSFLWLLVPAGIVFPIKIKIQK